jgi:hypothetical protein
MHRDRLDTRFPVRNIALIPLASKTKTAAHRGPGSSRGKYAPYAILVPEEEHRHALACLQHLHTYIALLPDSVIPKLDDSDPLRLTGCKPMLDQGA